MQVTGNSVVLVVARGHLPERGMSTREIQGHLEEIYKVEVSPTLISNVTAAPPRNRPSASWSSRHCASCRCCGRPGRASHSRGVRLSRLAWPAPAELWSAASADRFRL